VVNFITSTRSIRREQSALRNIDIRIQRGEFIFIAGSSGAGKSTLLKLLFAEESATRGQVIVAGRNLTSVRASKSRYCGAMSVLSFRTIKLIRSRSVLENVAFALEVIGVQRREREKLAFKMLAAARP